MLQQQQNSPECGNLGKQGIIHSYISFYGYRMIPLKLQSKCSQHSLAKPANLCKSS